MNYHRFLLTTMQREDPAVKKSLTLLSYRSNLYLLNLIKAFLLNLLSGGTNFDKATLSWGEF